MAHEATIYEIDLQKVTTDDFLCPGCEEKGIETIISADDDTNFTYKHVGVEYFDQKVGDKDPRNLKSSTLECQECESKIKMKF